MAGLIRNFLGVVLVSLATAAALAQDEATTTEEAIDTLDRMVAEVNEFVGHVRFADGDVRSLLDLWDEFSQFEDDDDADDGTIDFDAILADSEFRRWAASHNLDADDWLRKSVRITMALYREQMLAMAAMMPGQMAQQLEMIEQQREQMGEETYQEARQGMKEMAEYGKAITDSSRRLPEPTAEEKAILDQYRDELMVLMESGEDDEEYGEYDEYDEYEEYEDDEDYEGYDD